MQKAIQAKTKMEVITKVSREGKTPRKIQFLTPYPTPLFLNFPA